MSYVPGAVGLEERLLEDVGVDEGWALLERFSTLVRESGSADEHAAAEYIAARLAAMGVEHEVYEPDLYLSLPRESWVEAGGERLEAKPPSFAVPTPGSGIEAELVHVPSTAVTGQRDLFERHVRELPDVRGKIVLTEGYAMPASVALFEAAGAAGQIYVNPGENIHWGICTPIWGHPTTRDLDRKPGTPVVAVSRPSGERLAARAGDRVLVRAHLEEGWYPCKLPVARIPGASDDFMLVHGHYDSWDVGIGDNAVGDATLLELARIFHGARADLERTLWIAWWPGHSTGRYAGSTWFADRFALDLRHSCVGAVNIDSPGCWHATEYDEVMWMAEAGPLCEAAIADVTGKTPRRLRPLRAGDYSFNQIGLTSFYMLLSNIPEEEREELGFYPTGGCGGNIAWHTEDDRLPIADRDNLERDLRVYVASIARVLNASVELDGLLAEHETAAAGLLDISFVRRELVGLSDALEELYGWLDRVEPGRERAAELNALFLRLSRLLVPVSYAESGDFEHDPALPRVPIPRLAGTRELAPCAEERPERLPFLVTGLRRAANHVANVFREAALEVGRFGAHAGVTSRID